MRGISGPRLIAIGAAVFAVGFIVGIMEHEGSGFWNKVSAVLGPIGVVLVLVGIVLTVVRRARG
jgi:hypothetical protein